MMNNMERCVFCHGVGHRMDECVDPWVHVVIHNEQVIAQRVSEDPSIIDEYHNYLCENVTQEELKLLANHHTIPYVSVKKTICELTKKTEKKAIYDKMENDIHLMIKTGGGGKDIKMVMKHYHTYLRKLSVNELITEAKTYGFSTETIEEKINEFSQDGTYLRSLSVDELIEGIKIYNFSAQSIENKIDEFSQHVFVVAFNRALILYGQYFDNRLNTMVYDAQQLIPSPLPPQPQLKMNDNNDVVVCPLCLEEINTDDQMMTNCKHPFCIKCFINYMHHKDDIQIEVEDAMLNISCKINCPMCRTIITGLYPRDRTKFRNTLINTIKGDFNSSVV